MASLDREAEHLDLMAVTAGLKLLCWHHRNEGENGLGTRFQKTRKLLGFYMLVTIFIDNNNIRSFPLF